MYATFCILAKSPMLSCKIFWRGSNENYRIDDTMTIYIDDTITISSPSSHRMEKKPYWIISIQLTKISSLPSKVKWTKKSPFWTWKLWDNWTVPQNLRSIEKIVTQENYWIFGALHITNNFDQPFDPLLIEQWKFVAESSFKMK